MGGVSENGYSTSHLGEAQMMQQMIESASRVVILADASKFGRHAFVHICALEDSTALVTNALPQPDLDQALREADVDIIVAES